MHIRRPYIKTTGLWLNPSKRRRDGLLTSNKSWDDVFWDEEANDIQFDYEDLYDALNNDDIFDIQKALFELTYLED
jgi:hypothetical protein